MIQSTFLTGLRKLLLVGIYAAATLGILATGGSSGGGGNGTSVECSLSVRGLAPLVGGSIWIGVLADVEGTRKDLVVLLDADGVQLASFEVGDAGADNAVRAVAAATDGSGDIYVGGDFAGGVLRLNSDGTLDGGAPGFDVGNGFDDRVTSLAPISDGDVYVGGSFDSFERAPNPPAAVGALVRLNSNGSRDATFGAAVTFVETVALPENFGMTAEVYSGGTGTKSPERWSSTGGPSPTFNPLVNTPVLSIAPAVDLTNDIYIGGTFVGGIARLGDNGLNVGTFAVGAGFDDDVVSIARRSTTAITVGGEFGTYKAVAANGIVRLEDDGDRDVNFVVGSGFINADATATGVATVAQAADGSGDVIVAGSFVEYDGTPVNGITRLDDTGSIVAGFGVDITVDGESCTDDTLP